MALIRLYGVAILSAHIDGMKHLNRVEMVMVRVFAEIAKLIVIVAAANLDFVFTAELGAAVLA